MSFNTFIRVGGGFPLADTSALAAIHRALRGCRGGWAWRRHAQPPRHIIDGVAKKLGIGEEICYNSQAVLDVEEKENPSKNNKRPCRASKISGPMSNHTGAWLRGGRTSCLT